MGEILIGFFVICLTIVIAAHRESIKREELDNE